MYHITNYVTIYIIHITNYYCRKISLVSITLKMRKHCNSFRKKYDACVWLIWLCISSTYDTLLNLYIYICVCIFIHYICLCFCCSILSKKKQYFLSVPFCLMMLKSWTIDIRDLFLKLNAVQHRNVRQHLYLNNSSNFFIKR